MAVDMKLLKQLRAMTHAPMNACKSAIEEADGDLDRAQEILREKGALKAAKKADRETNEGIVVVEQFGDKVVGLKLACETDFVAKNETFKRLWKDIVEKLSTLESLENYAHLDATMKEDLEKVLKDNFVTIGENMQIIDAFVQTGTSYVYRHPGDKIASIIFYQGDEEKAKSVALQVAAMNPSYLSVDDVAIDEQVKYRTAFEAEVKDSGKPTDIMERIVEGKLGKIWAEIVLLEQSSIIDDTKTVKALLGDTMVTSYIRLAI